MNQHRTNQSTLLSAARFIVHEENIGTFVLFFTSFAAVYSFFYGVFTIPLLEIGFLKTGGISMTDYVYIIAASLLSGGILTLIKKQYNKSADKRLFAGGFLGSAFGFVCSACLAINLLFLGNVISIPLAFIVPYLWLIQVASIILFSAGFWVVAGGSMHNVAAPKIVVAKTHAHKADDSYFDFSLPVHKYALYVLTIIAVAFLIYQIIPATGLASTGAVSANGIDMDKITEQVVPEKGFVINAKWGTAVKNMVDSGAIDTEKLESLLKTRYGQEMKPEWKRILAGADEKLEINAGNSVFMMYVLWALAKHNDVPIIHNSRFASSFKNYDIGVGKAGYGDTKVLELTEEQLKIADSIAQNAYRPCCGQSTANPDCSHGYSALGLIELMASQGFSEKEIFGAFVKFNSFWFPATYIQNALYFKLAENKEWSEVDKKLVSGEQFSSLQGSYNVKKYLQDAGY